MPNLLYTTLLYYASLVFIIKVSMLFSLHYLLSLPIASLLYVYLLGLGESNFATFVIVHEHIMIVLNVIKIMCT